MKSLSVLVQFERQISTQFLIKFNFAAVVFLCIRTIMKISHTEMFIQNSDEWTISQIFNTLYYVIQTLRKNTGQNIAIIQISTGMGKLTGEGMMKIFQYWKWHSQIVSFFNPRPRFSNNWHCIAKNFSNTYKKLHHLWIFVNSKITPNESSLILFLLSFKNLIEKIINSTVSMCINK